MTTFPEDFRDLEHADELESVLLDFEEDDTLLFLPVVVLVEIVATELRFVLRVLLLQFVLVEALALLAAPLELLRRSWEVLEELKTLVFDLAPLLCCFGDVLEIEDLLWEESDEVRALLEAVFFPGLGLGGKIQRLDVLMTIGERSLSGPEDDPDVLSLRCERLSLVDCTVFGMSGVRCNLAVELVIAMRSCCV